MTSAAWGGGYVTDVGYMPGWYPQQSPMHLATTCLLMGVACDLPAGHEEVHYMELGCGLGYGAMTLAAANPSWRITAVDFNPAHIAFARGLAREAGLHNVLFLEADLATLADQDIARAIPEADFVSLHGVWSWVPQPVRDGIVRLLRNKVRAGGIVHMSYNALPGWQSAIGFQRLLLEAGRSRRGSAEQRLASGLSLVQALNGAGAYHLAGHGLTRMLIQQLPTLPEQYLAHEYLNESWSPCFHADVMDAMTGAKLDWVGSANLTENFADLMLSDTQREVYRQADDVRLRELVKDMSLQRALRHDVFVRGAQRINDATRDATLRELVLALTTPLDSVKFEVEVGSGIASLSPDYYGPMLARLSAGPCSVNELMALPETRDKTSDAREVVGILVGIGHAIAMLRPNGMVHPGAQEFNRIASRWLMRPENLTKPLALAAMSAGGGFPASAIDLYVNERMLAGDDPSAVDSWVSGLGVGDPQQRDGMRSVLLRACDIRRPLMRVAGVV